jgi:hypothetical protein
MPSNALDGHLFLLLSDAVHLREAAAQLPVGIPRRTLRVAALNRAIVVTCASAWEAYIEELVREAVELLRPPSAPLGVWSAHYAGIRGQLGRFHNPNTENIRMLMSDALGLPDIQNSWTWQNCSSRQAIQRLAEAMNLRHKIAHGVNPRPYISTLYASQLLDFFRKLGRATDRAVRDHVVNVLCIANPWPS